ncbi:hypothetical protein [Rhabdothermincola sp.]|uniref:hypothetical protein n=1 Tax=Rhabdothermincola sp. TaxID=2820405 RepID=UPI002FE1BFF1
MLSTLPASAATAIGPSTTTAPYVLPDATGVDIHSLLTVSDTGAATNGYEMVGIPDGLGAYRSGRNVRVLMNHELGASSGAVRKHGQRGAFVSDLTLRTTTGEVTKGEDLIDPGVRYYDYLTDTYAKSPNGSGLNVTTGRAFPAYNAAFARFCSGTLAEKGRLYNPVTGNGYRNAIWMANEESGDEGRVFGVTTAGKAYQLPRLGLASWENMVPAPNETDTTTVMGLEDGPSTGSQLWIYTGTKTSSGSPMDRAGLTNGTNHVLQVGGGPLSDAGLRAMIAADPDGKVDWTLSEVDWRQSGAAQNAEALAEGVNFNRVEDGEFDPHDKNVFYFVTTQGGVGATSGIAGRDGGGLWRLTFNDVENPAAGGTIELLLDGSEAIQLNKPDNLTIDRDNGIILIQEDPGNNNHRARIVAYRIADGATASLASFDAALFAPGAPGLLTLDEESSGIIDVTDLGFAAPKGLLPGSYPNGGVFLFDAQVHTASGLDNAAMQVERGQLLIMAVADWDTILGPVTPIVP